MNLLIVSDNFPPRWDGIAKFLTELVPRLKRFQVTLAVPDFSSFGETPDLGVKTVFFPVMNKHFGDFPPARLSRDSFKKIKALVKTSDLIFVNSSGSLGLMTVLSLKKNKKPLIAYTHTIEWELVPKAIQFPIQGLASLLALKYAKWFYNHFNLLLVPSQQHADLLQWYGFKPRKIVLRLGVDKDVFKPAKDKYLAKKHLGLEDYFLIGYHGRIGFEKDLLTLLRAFLRFRQHNKQSKLVIIGDGVKSIKKKLIEKKAIVTGFLQDPVPWLQALDVYVMPSLVDTTCLSLLEAMACGLPCISTNVGYVSDYFKHNVNGLLFNKRDEYQLYKLLTKLYKNPELRNRLASNARSVVNTYSWQNTAKNFESIALQISENFRKKH